MKKIGFVLLSCMCISTAQAAGFATGSGYSASGIGVANAVVAGAEDVSAAAYNPAGLAWQDDMQVMLGFIMQYRNSSVDLGPNSAVVSNSGSAPNLSHFYYSWIPRESNLGLSVAFNRPYEMDNGWSNAFPGTAGSSTLKMDRLSLDAIYRLNSTMAFSVGGDWYLSTAAMSQGAQTFSGKGKTSFGGHASMKWKPAPTWSVGALVRLGSSVKLSGGVDQSMKIKLPDELTVGIAHDMADTFRLELDANWSRWSKLKNLNVLTGTAVTQSNVLDLKDSLSLMAGLTWFWRENSQFRFGYAYEKGANSDALFHPAIADQTGHKLSLGAGGSMFGAHFDLAYAYTFYPKSTVTGPFAGIYRDRRMSLALSVSKGF